MSRLVLLLVTALTGPALAQGSFKKPIELLPMPSAPPPNASRGGSAFTPAPVPNRNASVPPGPRVRRPDTEFSPSLFNRSEQYRGDGFVNGSTAQSDQEKHIRPGAGFNLRMPLQPDK